MKNLRRIDRLADMGINRRSEGRGGGIVTMMRIMIKGRGRDRDRDRGGHVSTRQPPPMAAIGAAVTGATKGSIGTREVTIPAAGGGEGGRVKGKGRRRVWTLALPSPRPSPPDSPPPRKMRPIGPAPPA